MGSLPLNGVRVLDLTMVWAGPFGTKLLADMGAEVIKLEAPRNLDLVRTLGLDALTSKTIGPGSYNRSAYFNEYNRNKLGAVLDLSHPRGRELFLRLVAISDVVVENYRADVMQKLNLEYETLRQVKPGIIMASMPAYSKRTAEKDLVGYGPNIEQMSGLTTLNGYRDGPPQKTGISYGDPVAGTVAASAVIAALIYRRRTGKGQYIEVSQRNTLIGVIGEAVMLWGMNRHLEERGGNRHPWMAPHGCYPCRPLSAEEARPLAAYFSAGKQDARDRWITIAIRSDSEWRALCELMERPELAGDPRFTDGLSRHRNQDDLDEIIARWTEQHEDYELFHLLQACGIPAGPVLSPLGIGADAHLQERGFLEVVQHPEMGKNVITRPTWRLTRPAHPSRPAPCFGEHNRYVFGELLGLSDQEIADLERAEVVTGEPLRATVGLA